MEVSHSVPELVAAARASAKTSEDRIAQIVASGDSSDAARTDLRDATITLSLVAVDIYSNFEKQMQHHFKRGPFSRKLSAQLVADGKADLADRVHQYYLAANVLKHGKGASYRELINAPTALFSVFAEDDENRLAGLIDVSSPGFFDGLCATLIEAHDFLEKR